MAQGVRTGLRVGERFQCDGKLAELCLYPTESGDVTYRRNHAV